MRIVLLITMGVERPSGIRYFSIARELVRRGCRARILALHPDLANCPQRRFIRDGVEVWYVGQMHARKSGSIPQRFGPFQLLRVLFMSTLGMIWGIICSPAEVYHLGKPQPINGLAALIGVALLRRRRFYVDCDDDEVLSNRLTAGWQRAVFAFWQWLLPRLAAGVSVNTQALAERVCTIGGVPWAYVPNGVDLERFTQPDRIKLAALRRAMRLEGRRIVAYAGTLALQNHPVDLLLDAFVRVAAERDDVDLLLIGGGEDLHVLQQHAHTHAIKNRVHFTGQLSHEQVPAYLALADVSVDPVRDDEVARTRSPLKLMESLALGVPVITGDVGDRRAILAVGGGWVTQPGDAGALAQVVLERLADPAALEHARVAAQHTARQYTWQALSAPWAALYHHKERLTLDQRPALEQQTY
jgi:glycosyltransferase involved in cell wall biosynthesis